MKKVFLKRLQLSNFRAQSRTIDFSEKTEIWGRNKAGKSTIFNAWLWVILGVDEFNRTNFQLFNNKIENTYENSVPAKVEALLEIDGNEYMFRREASIGWVRKRSNSQYERSGSDNYKFFIDGIEHSATDYKRKIEELIAPIDKLKIMLNIRYFLMLDWKEMRKQMECLAGEIKESDFQGDYSDIESDLKKYSIENLKKTYKEQKRHIYQQVDAFLPKAIETLKSNLPDITGIGKAQSTIDECNAEIDSLMKEMEGRSLSLQPYINKRNEELKDISSLEEEYKQAEAVYQQNYFEELSKCKSHITEIERKNEQIEQDNRNNRAKHESLKMQIKSKQTAIQELQVRREALLEQNRLIKALVFEENTCPYCGQELPMDKMEEQRNKFNASKESKHRAIVAEGKANNEKIKAYQDEIVRMNDELQRIAPFDRPLEDVSQVELQYLSVKNNFVPYEKTPEGKAKGHVIEEKRLNMTLIPEIDNSSIRIRLDEVTKKKDEAMKEIGLKQEYDRQMSKIENLQNELIENNKELAYIEKKIGQVEKYEREKASLLSDKVNMKFSRIRVKMSDINKSGEIIDTCIILDNNGVNAEVTNNASRILVGIELSLAFQRHYSISLPMFIDNAETLSIDNKPMLSNQSIMLYVDGSEMRINNL